MPAKGASAASSSERLQDVYRYPLPYRTSPLPPLFFHNPVSVLVYVYACFLAAKSGTKQVIYKGKLDPKDVTRTVKVEDTESMNSLWRMGFFGKGTLSRSEPSWFGRTARRLGLDGGDYSLEEITEQRRSKRRQMKKERALAERRALSLKRQQEGLPPLPDVVEHDEPSQVPSSPAEVETRAEDLALMEGSTIRRLEYLQLTPYEALFLAGGLGVLDVTIDDDSCHLSELINRLIIDDREMRNYVVYHYFRSMGWCVRNGVKFGTDYLLYRRGPPFQHAEFAIVVMGADEQRDWQWHQGAMRVVGTVRKTLMHVYVSGPDLGDWIKVKTANDLRNLLSRYTLSPVSFSRWSPNRTRD